MDIGQIWLLGCRGCAAGARVRPWGCGTAQVSQGTAQGEPRHSRAQHCQQGVGGVYPQLSFSPQDFSSTTILMGPSGSPHPTPLIKQRFQLGRTNKSFSVQQKLPQAGRQQMKFPPCLQMGTQPLTPISDLQKMWGVLISQDHFCFIPYCSG